MTKEQKFYKALQDVFVGAKIEGKGGFVNLMRIKSNYYRKIEDILKKDIEAALKSHPKFRDELFDKLYSFFSRYFTESGSIYFNSTPFHNNIYEKVYTDEKDVILFWKTQMLYYVKTDRIFRSLPVEFDGFKFYFDASKIENKKTNEKRSLIFELSKIREDNTIVFSISYSEKGAKTKQDEILKAIKKKGIAITEEQLERAFRVFEKQSEVDFFINKNAKAFLEEQFKLWSYQYFWEGAKEWGADRVNQLQILKVITFKIIDFISQFEDELVKIWNKPKFVKNSNYVITLDRILSIPHSERSEKSHTLIQKILKHKGIKDQIKEWQELGIIDDKFKISDVFETDLTGKHLSKKYEHLPIDTKYFKDLELEILGLFDNLDNQLDGWLIKSENYQALNTILPKFNNSIDCVYIDPPYNAEGSEILYVNNLKSSSWLSLMENRLEFVKKYLSGRNSGLVVAVDDYEMAKLVELLKDKFVDYEVNPIIVNHHPQGTPKANISRTHEYVILVTPTGTDFVKTPRSKDKSDERSYMRSGTGRNNFRYGRPNSFYAILIDPSSEEIKGVEECPIDKAYSTGKTREGFIRIYPIDGNGQERVWRKSYKSAIKAIAEGIVFCRKNKKKFIIYEKVAIERVKPTSNWFDSKYNAGTHGTTLLTNLFGGGKICFLIRNQFILLKI